MPATIDLSGFYLKALTINVADAQGGYGWFGCTGPSVITENHGVRIAHTSGGTGAGRGLQVTNIYNGSYASTAHDAQAYATSVGAVAMDHIVAYQSFVYVQGAASLTRAHGHYTGGQNQGSGVITDAYGFYHVGWTNTGAGSISNKWAFYAAADMSSFAGLTITGGASGTLIKDAALGIALRGATGSSFDLGMYGPGGATIMQVPTGTVNVAFSGSVKVSGGASAAATIATLATLGLTIRGNTGSTHDFGIFGPGGATILQVVTGTVNVTFAGAVITPAGTTSIASLRVPHGSAPTSPVNGDMWTTTAGLFVRINSVTVGPLT